MSEDEVRQAVADAMQRQFEASFFGAATTNAVPTAQPTLRADDFTRMCRKWDMMARQNRLVFRVDQAHQGPMLKHETNGEGVTFEMSFLDAQSVHAEWPMRLHKIVDEHCAEFVPGSVFDTFIPKFLPLPPFEIPDEEVPPSA